MDTIQSQEEIAWAILNLESAEQGKNIGRKSKLRAKKILKTAIKEILKQKNLSTWTELQIRLVKRYGKLVPNAQIPTANFSQTSTSIPEDFP